MFGVSFSLASAGRKRENVGHATAKARYAKRLVAHLI
jgi:hypothetical protein